MAEQSTTPEQKAEPERTAPGRQVTRRGGGSQADLLRSERGTTSLADAVVTKVAAIAAREIGGVHDLGGGVARAMGGVTGRVGMGTEATRGVRWRSAPGRRRSTFRWSSSTGCRFPR